MFERDQKLQLPSHGMATRGRRFAVLSTFTALCFAVPTMLLEAIVRIVGPQSLQAELTVPHDDYNHRLNPGVTLLARVAAEQYPVLLRINSQGLAQEHDVVIPKPKGIHRILILGDSFIQGLGHGMTLPAFVESGLAPWRTRDGRRFEVINGGTQSYSPLLHAARYLHQFAAMQPDAVIVFPDLTDVYDDNVRYKNLADYRDGKLIRVRPSKGLAIEWRTRRVLLYDDVPLHSYRYLVAKLAYGLALASSPSRPGADIFEHALDDEINPRPETLEAVRYTIANMKALVEQLSASGAHVTIMIYPHRGQIVPETLDRSTGRRIVLNRLFERSLVQSAHELDVPIVSFSDRIASEVGQGRQLYFRGDMHFNIDGLRQLSTFVTETILASSEETLGVSIPLEPPSR